MVATVSLLSACVRGFMLMSCKALEEQLQQTLQKSLDSQGDDMEEEKEGDDMSDEAQSKGEEELKKKGKKCKSAEEEGRFSKCQHKKGAGSRQKGKKVVAPPLGSPGPNLPPLPVPPAPPLPLPAVPPPPPPPPPPPSPLPSSPLALGGQVSDENIDPRLLGLAHTDVPHHMWDIIIMSGPNDVGCKPSSPSPSPPHRQTSPEPVDLNLATDKELGEKTGIVTFVNDSSWLKEGDVALLEHKDWWEGWFKVMSKYLSEYNFGERWESMLCCWTVLEGRRGFDDLKGGKHALPKSGHPMMIELWIKST